MKKYEVEKILNLDGKGELTIQGSKNSVLPILSACVLNEGEILTYRPQGAWQYPRLAWK